jgi:ZIP family zinc transporter
MAFASGTLVAALAFELFPKRSRQAAWHPPPPGFERGVDVRRHHTLVDSRVAAGAGHPSEIPLPDSASDALSGAGANQRETLTVAAQPEPGSTGVGVAFGLLAAVTLDGVPENLALGVSLVGSEGELSGVIALLVAIFVSAGGAVLASLADTLMPEAFDADDPSTHWRPPRLPPCLRAVGPLTTLP